MNLSLLKRQTAVMVLVSLLVSVQVMTALGAEPPIDRQAVVARHNIQWNDLRGQVPLGNGEFCFNADGTGLQTTGGHTLSHWAWHSDPLPEGCTPEDVPPTGTLDRGRITGQMRKAADKPQVTEWMKRNPHPLNLARLRLVRGDGAEIREEEIRNLNRSYDLWTGLHISKFELDGEPVTVQTVVHGVNDIVSVRVDSALVKDKKLAVAVDFPYPAPDGSPWAGNWQKPLAHSSVFKKSSANNGIIERTADGANYAVSVAWGEGGQFAKIEDASVKQLAVASPGHSFRLSSDSPDRLELSCGFAPAPMASVPLFAEAAKSSAGRWEKFWTSGGAVDLSGSKDPRWRELERRIVLSQYQMAAQSAGSWPPAEAGLTEVWPWSGQFHMEMIWWHLAHYALWNRFEMAEEALQCYPKFLPVARQLAAQFGYKGAKWGKQVGPEGRTAPAEISFVLHWQQPHPLFFAELEYRLRPTKQTLEKWREIVFESADYLADFPTRDEKGVYYLEPVMLPSEQHPTVRNPVFDLAYFRWALDTAQRWRERLGMPREPRWDEVRRNLAPLPVEDGLYIHADDMRDTYTKRSWGHPDMIGILGMLPPMEGVDAATARRTVNKVWEKWAWSSSWGSWGWDFPWMAMAAARVGEPQIAVEALLKEAGDRNGYDRRGINTGGPCPYLPGNGGVLYAVAMMCAGWDGAPERPAPGFPDNGNWTVRWEGLQKAP